VGLNVPDGTSALMFLIDASEALLKQNELPAGAMRNYFKAKDVINIKMALNRCFMACDNETQTAKIYNVRLGITPENVALASMTNPVSSEDFEAKYRKSLHLGAEPTGPVFRQMRGESDRYGYGGPWEKHRGIRMKRCIEPGTNCLVYRHSINNKALR
jgi:hypothetical protein